MLVGSHRADLGPKHEPGVTSNEGHSKSGSGVRRSVGIISAMAPSRRCCGRHFLLDWNGPVTEVLSLGNGLVSGSG